MPKSLSIYTNILSQKRPYDILWKTSRTDWIFQKNGLVVAYFFGYKRKAGRLLIRHPAFLFWIYPR
ncbi:hypothetical protein FZC71_08255 [Bacillus subtilis]|nr:hypothetical protein FZC71_08255 [Bacillus subtilis]